MSPHDSLRRWWLLATAVVLFFAPSRALADGPLDDVRQEVHGDSDSSSSSSSDDGGWDDDDSWGDDGDGGSGGDVSPAALCLLVPIVCGPIFFVEEGYDTPMLYDRHPYASSDGEMVPLGHETPYGVKAKNLRIQVAAESAYQVQDLWRFSGEARLSTRYRVGASTTWNYYRDFNNADQLWLGDAMLNVAFARGTHGAFWFGAGARFMIDDQPREGTSNRNAYGFNATWGGEVYPFRPLTLTLRADMGHLGKAFTAQLRGTAGVMLGPIEFYAGYDHLFLGRANLGGPVVGLRGHF